MTAAVELKGVEVRAGGRAILGPMDLVIRSGEHVLVAGASGSGKTTLLRAIAGLARPVAGTIALAGRPVSEGPRLLVRPEDRRIGYLFQGGGLWPHMTVRRTLDFVLGARGVPKADRAKRAAALLELVQLEGFDDRKPATLSGGEAQRLALARALAVDPELLLLDEPLGPLDAELRQALLGRLHELQERLELTVIHVTHDPGEARALATRTLRVEAGRIAPPEDRP